MKLKEGIANQSADGQWSPGLLLQRKCECGNHTMSGACDDCAKKKGSLQRKVSNNTDSYAVPPIVHEVLRSTGQPLDPATRSFMEPRFGHDFSHVRVHTDAKAAESARSVNALAYTVGHNVVLGDGATSSTPWQQRKTLAHELTHVIQQEAGSTRGGSGGLTIGPADDAHEHEAARAERTIADRASIGSTNSLSQPRVQRSPYDVLKPGPTPSPEIKVTPTSRLIPFSEIDFRVPPPPTRPIPVGRPAQVPKPYGPEPPPKVASPGPESAPAPGTGDPEQEDPEVKALVEGSMSDQVITTNLEVGIPVGWEGTRYVLGEPFIIGEKNLTLTLKAGPPKPPFGLPPAQSELSINLAMKALRYEFEPITSRLKALKELQLYVAGEADIDPLAPFRPELGIKTELSAEVQLGRSPVSLFGKVGYKLSFPPGGKVEAAPTWDFGFKVVLPQFGRKPQSRKQ